MTAIDPSRGQSAVTRTSAGVREGTGRSGEKSRAGTAARSGQLPGAAMLRRIAAIPPDAPDRPRQAVRLYLESELAREFGAGLLNDPEFPALLDAVQQRMQEDGHTADAVEALGRLLLAGQAPGA